MTKGSADAKTIKDKYTLLDHTADIGISLEAETVEDLFARVACAMFDLMVDISQVQPVQKGEVSLQADNLEELMVTWLNELIFRADVNGMFFSKFVVESVRKNSLKASVSGEPYDEKVHSPGQAVKAATYHQLKVSQTENGWFAKVIFDV